MVGASLCGLVSLLIQAAPASAASGDSASLVLTGVTVPTVARGGAPSAIMATISNLGPANATGAFVDYQLPNGIEFAPQTSTPSCSATSATTVRCTLGTVSAGDREGIAIGVREADANGPLSQRLGAFRVPQSAEFNPGSGEIEFIEWAGEADGQGESLLSCWSVQQPSPATDLFINSDPQQPGCDGAADSNPPAITQQQTLSGFSPPYTANVGNSWQWRTRITAPISGSYRVCGIQLDDGAYVAITPAGEAFLDDSVVLDMPSYGSATSAPFALNAGVRYDVLIRVANRGNAGSYNGGAGPGGWNAVGIAPASATCTAADKAAFGTGPGAWQETKPSTVNVVGASDLAVETVLSSKKPGSMESTMVFSNRGNDAASAESTFEVPAGARVATPTVGCLLENGASKATCALGSLPPGASAAVTLQMSGEFRRPIWMVDSADTIDQNPANNAQPLLPA